MDLLKINSSSPENPKDSQVPLVYPSNCSSCKNVLLINNSIKEYNLFVDSVNTDTFPIVYFETSSKTELLQVLQTTFSSSIERIGIVFSTNLYSSNLFLDKKPFFEEEEPGNSPYSENIEFLLSIIKEFNVKHIDYLGCETLLFPKWQQYYSILEK